MTSFLKNVNFLAIIIRFLIPKYMTNLVITAYNVNSSLHTNFLTFFFCDSHDVHISLLYFGVISIVDTLLYT